jgi:TolB protein
LATCIQFDTRPDPFNTGEALGYALPVDVALGKADYLEVMGYSDHRITSEIWYRLLNCGFRLPAGAGTDAFPNFASLRGPPGLLRTYVKLGPALDHRRWLDAIKAGRTFVTNAPLLEFALGKREPGEEIMLPAGTHQLVARVRLRSNVPVDRLEIIGNGAVVASIPLAGARDSADTTVTLRVGRSGWYVLRAWSARATTPVLDLYPFGSTSPVYVTVGGLPVRSAEDARYFVQWVDRVEAAARAQTSWNTDEERDAVLTSIARARAVYEKRLREAEAGR